MRNNFGRRKNYIRLRGKGDTLRKGKRNFINSPSSYFIKYIILTFQSAEDLCYSLNFKQVAQNQHG